MKNKTTANSPLSREEAFAKIMSLYHAGEYRQINSTAKKLPPRGADIDLTDLHNEMRGIIKENRYEQAFSAAKIVYLFSTPQERIALMEEIIDMLCNQHEAKRAERWIESLTALPATENHERSYLSTHGLYLLAEKSDLEEMIETQDREELGEDIKRIQRFRLTKRLPQALALGRQLLKTHPTNNFLCIELASAYRDRGDIPAAITLLEGVLQRNPNDWHALHKLGYIFYEQERYANALAMADRWLAIPEQKNDLTALKLKGMATSKTGNFDKADAIFSHIDGLRKNPPPTRSLT